MGANSGLAGNEGANQANIPASATLPNGNKEVLGQKEDKSVASLFIQNLIQQ